MNSRKEGQVDEREWEMQERGLRAMRDGGTARNDPAAESYRRVAAALDCAPRSEPPRDFASEMAMQIARQNAGIERALFRGLFLLLAVSALIVTALYGGQWWQAMQATLTDGALQWILAGAGCMALSWMIGQLRRSTELMGS